MTSKTKRPTPGSTMRKDTRSNPLETAPAGWSLARTWRAAVRFFLQRTEGSAPMPFCPECGTQHEGAKFCPNCGVPQTAVSTAKPAAAAPGAEDDQLQSEETLWEGEAKNVANLASRGKVVQARYRLTNRALYFTRGVLTTNSEQVPLWAIRDIDIKQSLIQKRRGVGDVNVRVQHSDYTGRPFVLLESIENPTEVRDLLNAHAQRERLWYDERARTRVYTQRQ